MPRSRATVFVMSWKDMSCKTDKNSLLWSINRAFFVLILIKQNNLNQVTLIIHTLFKHKQLWTGGNLLLFNGLSEIFDYFSNMKLLNWRIKWQGCGISGSPWLCVRNYRWNGWDSYFACSHHPWSHEVMESRISFTLTQAMKGLHFQDFCYSCRSHNLQLTPSL